MTEASQSLRTRRILRRPMVQSRTGLGRSSIYKGMAEGWFPRCVQIGPRAVGWFEADIEEWLDSRQRKES